MPAASDAAAAILALYTELLLHFIAEIRLIASDYRYDLLNVLPDDLFQHNGTNIMSAALALVDTMGGADEEVLPLFKIAGGGVVELRIFGLYQEKRRYSSASSVIPFLSSAAFCSMMRLSFLSRVSVPS